MENLALGIVIICCAFLVYMAIKMPLEFSPQTEKAMQAHADRIKKDADREEKASKILVLLGNAPTCDLTVDSVKYKKAVEWRFLDWADWPFPSEADPNVIYTYKSAYSSGDPKYICKDGQYYRINWVPSEEELRKQAFTKFLENYKKKSKHLYKWRNARRSR